METGVIGITKNKSIKYYAFMISKRLFDLICAIIGILVLIPLMLIIKIAYVLHKDYNSIIYTQDRVGKDGKLFKLYKFRTMVPNADEVLDKILKEDPLRRREWQLTQKLHDDPRITKIGKVFRKASLDEMPQMINVLKGDMSIIGPRPLVKNELDNHNGIHELYESVKPGITGWWATNGRSDIEDYNERLNLEYYYINNISIKIDTLVLFRTFKVIFNKKGAK